MVPGFGSLTFVIVSAFVSSSQSAGNKTCDFRFGTMVLLTGSRSRLSVAAGFNAALLDYRNGLLFDSPQIELSNLQLFNCTIDQDPYDMQSDIGLGTVLAFEMGQSFASQSNKSINVPIVVGPPTSGYALTLNRLISAFDLLQFSSTASSTALALYNSFFRSIPSDNLQGLALIKLCKYFNWNRIGILHMNTIYGSSMQQTLTTYAQKFGIESKTFRYIMQMYSNINYK